MKRSIGFALARHALAACLLAASLGASAAPVSDESIETLLELTHAESLVDTVYASVEQMIRQGMNQALQGKPLSAEQRTFIDGIPARFAAVMREEFNWQKMKPVYMQLYRETFDQAEIDGLIAFYRSPAGQSFIAKMPKVMQKSMVVVQEQMRAMMPKIQEATAQAMEEAKALK
jgi:uncharacterized protein